MVRTGIGSARSFLRVPGTSRKCRRCQSRGSGVGGARWRRFLGLSGGAIAPPGSSGGSWGRQPPGEAQETAGSADTH
eukprot:49980-Alexandrium_andersonii.AAC.1